MAGPGRWGDEPVRTPARREPEPGRAAADRYVHVGVRSTEEVRAYLAARRVSPETAERWVREYERRGALNDRACARLWAEQWARQGYGWSVIHHRLTTKGLPPEAIDDAAKRVGHPSAELSRARALVARRARGRLAWSRLARTLASRGFEPELIEQVLRESLTPISDAER